MYPETILILSKQTPNVRSIDISEYMGYSKPSVSRAVGLLKSGSYISVDSDGFAGKTIAIRESHLPGQITLVFRQFRIGRIDLDNRVYTLRKAYLLEGDPRANV